MTELSPELQGLRTKALARQLDDVQRASFASFFDSITQDTPLVAMLRRNAERVRQQENEL